MVQTFFKSIINLNGRFLITPDSLILARKARTLSNVRIMFLNSCKQTEQMAVSLFAHHFTRQINVHLSDELQYAQSVFMCPGCTLKTTILHKRFSLAEGKLQV